MTRTSRILALAIAMAFTLVGTADAAKSKKKKKAKEEEPAPVAGEEMELMQKGHAAFLIRDHDKAYDLYKQAAEIAPKSPLVHYFMGVALKAKGEYEDAVEAFRTAYLMATGKEETWKGPALVQIAFTHETAGKWDDARKAWEDYVEYAKGKGLKVNATSLAEKRIEAIDKMTDLDEQYESVREAIEKEKAAKEAD